MEIVVIIQRFFARPTIQREVGIKKKEGYVVSKENIETYVMVSPFCILEPDPGVPCLFIPVCGKRHEKCSTSCGVPSNALSKDVATDPALLPEDKSKLPPRAEETANKTKSLPSTDFLKPNTESMEATPSEIVEDMKEVPSTSLVADLTPPIYVFCLPFPYPHWTLSLSPFHLKEDVAETSNHQIHKRIPAYPKEPVYLDEIFGISQLCLKESVHVQPSRLTLKLTGEHSSSQLFMPASPSIPKRMLKHHIKASVDVKSSGGYSSCSSYIFHYGSNGYQGLRLLLQKVRTSSDVGSNKGPSSQRQ